MRNWYSGIECGRVPSKESLKGLAELILAKQRSGPTGTAKLTFLKQYTLFADRAFHVDGESEYGGDQ